MPVTPLSCARHAGKHHVMFTWHGAGPYLFTELDSDANFVLVPLQGSMHL